MKNCNDIQACAHADEILETYLDGELAPDELRWLERHWETCEACRHERDLALHVQATLHALPELQCPDRLVPSRPVFARRRRSWALASAALAAACFALVVAFHDSAPHSPGEPPETVTTVAPQGAGPEAADQARVVLAYLGGVGLMATETLQREALAPAAQGLASSLQSALGQVLSH